MAGISPGKSRLATVNILSRSIYENQIFFLHKIQIGENSSLWLRVGGSWRVTLVILLNLQNTKNPNTSRQRRWKAVVVAHDTFIVP